jgi:hypothetical protein
MRLPCINAHIAFEDDRECVVHVCYSGNIVEGCSTCHLSDSFDSITGRQLAVAHALMNLSIFIRSSALGSWPDKRAMGFVNPVSRSYCPVCRGEVDAEG